MIKYDKYKSSEIEWLGDIPYNWEVKRIKDVLIKIGSGVTPKGGSEVYLKSGIPLVRSQNVYDDGLRLDNVSFISESINDKMKNSQIQPNDILINITGASIGRSCVVPNSLAKANINQHIIYLRINSKLVPFIAYFIKSNSFKEYINLIQAGTSKEALNMGQTMNIPILLPNEDLQKKIVDFINIKTQAIEKKIILLTKKTNYYKEYKKSLINETVCRGLDKNIKLKNSGIDWIDKIPEHWNIVRLKNIFEFSKGKNSSKYNQDYVNDIKNFGEFPVYSGQTENDGIMARINSFDYSFETEVILVTTVGAKAMEAKLIKDQFSLSQNCAMMNLQNNKFNIHFAYFFVTQLFYEERKIIPTIMQPSLRIDDLNKFKILFPPLSEQIQIASYLEQKTQIIDKIVFNINLQIQTLKELRKTLINDVVTGKIKVTN